MNPNEILAEIRFLLTERNDDHPPMTTDQALRSGHRLAELIGLLDEQMCDGILPPDDWGAYITPTQRQYGKRYTP